jgi:hypothetical protein
MSITAKQSKLIHMACNRAGLDDAQYRVLLHNTARVASSKDLDQRGFEDVMAVLEDYENRGGDTGGNTYWRDKVATRGTRNNERMLHLIRELAVNQRYDLAAMCQRFSRGRTDQADQLNSREQSRRRTEIRTQCGPRLIARHSSLRTFISNRERSLSCQTGTETSRQTRARPSRRRRRLRRRRAPVLIHREN